MLGGGIESGIRMQDVLNDSGSGQKIYGTYEIINNKPIDINGQKAVTWNKIALGPDSLKVTLSDESSRNFLCNIVRAKKQLVLFANNRPDTLYTLDYAESPKSVTLKGEYNNTLISFKFKKTSDETAPLMTRGFHWINEYPNNK